MVHEIFISYPSENKAVADSICASLEQQQYRCWMAPRDILPGQNFAEALYDAIDSSRIFVLVFSDITNKSPHIMSEVQRAFNNNIVIIPFRVEAVEPSKALQYYIGTAHWLDAFTPPLEEQVEKLQKVVAIFLDRSNVAWEDQVKVQEEDEDTGPVTAHPAVTPAAVHPPEQEHKESPGPTSVQEPRQEPETARFCTACSTPLKPGARFCVKCGHNTTSNESGVHTHGRPVPVFSQLLCPSCRKPLKAGVSFCGRCGARVTGAPSTAPPQWPVCPSCRNPVRPGSRFCSRCGKSL